MSVLTLSAIAVERWYAICYPLIFKSTKRRAQVIIVVIWIVSMFIAIPELVVLETFPFFGPEKELDTVLLTSCRPGWKQNQQMVHQIVLLVLLYVLPLILMGITYTQIAIVLWRGNIPGAIETSKTFYILSFLVFQIILI